MKYSLTQIRNQDFNKKTFWIETFFVIKITKLHEINLRNVDN